MRKIDVFFLYNTKLNDKQINIENNPDSVIVKLNIFNISNYEFGKELEKLSALLKIYNSIKRINLFFDKNINITITNKILVRVHNVLFQYYKITREIKLYQVSEESIKLMKELDYYKKIIMNPNKNPDTYLEYVKSRIPDTHEISVYNLKDTNDFPLTKAVGIGSQYPGHFVHIKPKKENQFKKTIYLVGKSVTFDSGGMNIKDETMTDMKIDMTGSAIIVSVLNLISDTEYAKKSNIHLILPIVENMIGNTATRPGYVVESLCGRTVEIYDTDAEGRLCLADGFEFIENNLIRGKDLSKCIVLDIATLTGNTTSITNGVTSMISSNEKGSQYLDKLMEIGEEIGEYLEFIKIRPEYLDMLDSKVADIKNISPNAKCGFIIAATFLNFFIDTKIPWVHIDLGIGTYINEVAQSHGVNLLFEFIKNID
jgi:leucyl aminopeptidase